MYWVSLVFRRSFELVDVAAKSRPESLNAAMRGADVLHEGIFLMKALRDLAPAKYLLRQTRDIVNGLLNVVRS